MAVAPCMREVLIVKGAKPGSFEKTIKKTTSMTKSENGDNISG
jgi:hypothetical protein